MTRFRALAIINERCYHKLFLYPIPESRKRERMVRKQYTVSDSLCGCLHSGHNTQCMQQERQPKCGVEYQRHQFKQCEQQRAGSQQGGNG